MSRRRPRFYIDCVPKYPFVGDIVASQMLPVNPAVRTRKPHRKGYWVDMVSSEKVKPLTVRVRQ